MTFFHALAGVFELVLLGALGAYLAAHKWFGAETRTLLPRLVTKVTLPASLIWTILNSFERGKMGELFIGALAPIIAVILLFLVAMLIGRLLAVERRHLGLFCASAANANTVFIGIPVNLALFGPNALPYALLYYFASTTFFWTVGHFAITCDIQDRGDTCFSLDIKRLISAPLIGFSIGLFLLFLNVSLPEPLGRALNSLGGLTTPLAILYIGIGIYDLGLSSLKLSKDLLLVIILRMILSPLIMALVLMCFDLPSLMGKVFIVQASLPVMMQAAILSANYNTDPNFGVQAVSISTLISILHVPLVMVLLG